MERKKLRKVKKLRIEEGEKILRAIPEEEIEY
jgi:hypothetical protein